MFKHHRTLVLDFTSGHALANQFCEILASSREFHIDVRRETVSLGDLTSEIKNVQTLLSSYVPSLSFLAFDRADSNRLSALFDSMRNLPNRHPWIIGLPAESEEDLIKCFQLGASDVLTPPFKRLEVLGRMAKWVWETLEETDQAAQGLKEKLGLGQIIGESKALLTAIQEIPTIANCNLTTLIRGETGTGKEICARAIHYLGPRRDNPFLALNCGGLSPDLVENELFGHESGAYTSASSSAIGLIQQADGGSLFLDEVDSLALSVQVKLLRFLQDKQFRPIGSRKSQTADLRFIAASNCDLKAAVEAGRFRRDLYYRLAVVELHLPPLRERGSDVDLLAQHFLNRYSIELKRALDGFGLGSLRKIRAYAWPGNVRELENVIARAVLFAHTSLIQPEDIQFSKERSHSHAHTFKALKASIIESFEKQYLAELLEAHRGNISKAAAAAGKDRRAFWQLLRKNSMLPTIST